MPASKSPSSTEFEQGGRIGREEEDESIVQQLHEASSTVTAALFAIELMKESERRELDSSCF
jgi:hypothetical protein